MQRQLVSAVRRTGGNRPDGRLKWETERHWKLKKGVPLAPRVWKRQEKRGWGLLLVSEEGIGHGAIDTRRPF